MERVDVLDRTDVSDRRVLDTEVDYSRAFTKHQVAAAAQCSTKAIERAVQRGALVQYFRPQAGTSPVAVYFPEDVAEWVRNRQPGPPAAVLVPDRVDVPPGLRPAVTGNGNGHTPEALVRVPATGISQISDIGSGEELLRALVTAAVKVMSQTSETADYEYLTIREAATACRLTQAYVRRRCEAHEVPAIRDRGWRIRRKDLERL